MSTIVLSEHLVNGILSYLATKPWSEVNGLINAIGKEANAQAAPAPPAPGVSDQAQPASPTGEAEDKGNA